MQPRTLDQILTELNGVYQPAISNIQAQQQALPGQTQAAIGAADAAKNTAYDQILGDARSRGIGFSGIPISEQYKYDANTYAPAVLQAKNDATNKAYSLEDAINQLNTQKYGQAQQISQYEQDLAEKKREFDAGLAAQQAASAASVAAPSFDYGSLLSSLANGQAGQGPKSASASAVQRADKGYNYFDASGKPISAYAYAQAKGLALRDVLSEAAKAGDKGSQAALNFVGNDGGYDPRKITNQSLADLYNALVWGTGRKPAGVYTAPRTIPTALVPINNPLALQGTHRY